MNKSYSSNGKSSSKRRRDNIVKNIKTGGSMIMYIGSAGLMTPQIQRAKQNQNGIMGLCTTGAGAILAIGLGNLGSKLLGKAVDKIADFWEDVRPKNNDDEEEEEEDG